MMFDAGQPRQGLPNARGKMNCLQLHNNSSSEARRMHRRLLCPLFLFVALLLPGVARGQSTPVSAPQASPDVAALSQEALVWLQALIRINTTNPPGNELAAANYIAGILEKEGIKHEVIEISPGRGIVIGRLGNALFPDSNRALMLLAHLDVVGVTREKWTVDPFAAVIKDGYLYGRGTIDDKGMVVANLAAFIALKRSGAVLDRDVIFLADDDEEQGGDSSIRVVVSKYWDKIAAGFALNEEGRVIVKDGKVIYVGIQTTEKVSVNVTMIATGTSGHASLPRADNAVVHLSAAVAKVGAYQAPWKLQPTTESYFEQVAKVEDDDTAKWIRALEMPDRKDNAAKHITDMSAVWNSMLRDTIAPTMLTAGVRANVIPSEARANLNVRLLPGDSIQDVIADLTKVVNDSQIRFEIAPDRGTPSPPSSMDSPLYKTIQSVSGQMFPGAVVMPFMSTGATDSAQLRLHGVQAYGLLPFPLTEDDVMRMHADDERIPLDSFQKGVAYMVRVVSEFVTKK
jgi:acetylornithine deacetylase/succinyl-diaminopimelate desuccinylase-like protein